MFFKKKKEKETTEMEQVPVEEVSEEVSAEEVPGKKHRFRNLSKKKKIALAIGAVLVIAAVVCVIFFGFPGMGSDNKVYVEKVSDIMGLGSGNGGQNRYAGVVESQETWNIKQNADKTVKEIYVKEGDSVKIGDKLFAYDNDEAKLNLEQAQLELERMENEIKAGEAEIHNLEKEKKALPEVINWNIPYRFKVREQPIRRPNMKSRVRKPKSNH